MQESILNWGQLLTIDHLPVDTTKKTLGVWTCPTSKTDGALDAMNEKFKVGGEGKNWKH